MKRHATSPVMTWSLALLTQWIISSIPPTHSLSPFLKRFQAFAICFVHYAQPQWTIWTAIVWRRALPSLTTVHNVLYSYNTRNLRRYGLWAYHVNEKHSTSSDHVYALGRTQELSTQPLREDSCWILKIRLKVYAPQPRLHATIQIPCRMKV